MEQLIQAIYSNDIVKFKRLFNEAMKPVVAKALEERKLEISRGIFVEGEEPDDDENDDEDDDDESEDKKSKPKKGDEE